jgi:ferredoxin-NADP reductase/ferredoxin
MASPMGGMGEMMGQMMGQPIKQFYPSLMDMPTLTPEARQFIEREAQLRLATGVQSITTGETELHRAMAAKDPVAIQKAAAGVREGLLQAESGAAALRALSEGQEPRQIALTWFKDQMSVPTKDGMSMSDGPLGMSWYHLMTMAFLGIFVVGTLVIHFARMRRISGLVARLANRASEPIPFGTAPPPVTSGVPPPPPAPGAPSPAADGSGGSRPASASRPTSTAAPPPPTERKRPWSGTLRVAAIFRETHDTKTLRMMNPQGGSIPFTFLPGHFLTFSVSIDGKRLRRSYTIASSPTQTGYVEVTVKRQEHRAVSQYLHDHVAVGSLLDVSAPAGRFTFTEEMGREGIVLIAGGVGITPMMSVTRYLTDTSFPGEIFFLFGARTTEDFIFREELEHLQRRHGNLHIAATMSRAQGSAWMGPEGPVSKEFIAHAVPELSRRHIHLCGPPPMMDAVKAALAELGVPKEQVMTEAFGPAEGIAPADSLETEHPAEAPSPPPSAIPAPAPSLPSPVVRKAGNGASLPLAASQIRFTISGKTGPLLANQPVLEAAEAIGVDIDFSCRVGICGVCKVKLLEGAVTMEVEEGLDPGDKELGMILACQAKSTGNLVVEA